MTLGTDARASGPDVIESAAALVVSSYPTELLTTPDRAMVRREAMALVDAIRRELAGEEHTWSERPPLDRLHLLRWMRRAVLEGWNEDGEQPLLDVMLAFESVERSLLEVDEDSSAADAVRPFARSLLREVAHALLSPLGSIVMLAETLREDPSGPLSEAQHRRLNIIHRAAISGAAISNDLLTLTSPRMHFEGKRRFPVSEAMEHVANLVRPVTEARRSELVLDQGVIGTRRGAGSAITQALTGLALRAALMTQDGSIEMGVEPGEGDMVVFSLTARGTPPTGVEDQFLIFRTESGAEGYTLSPEGLSLSAAKETLRSIGSELHVRSGAEGLLEMRFEVPLPPAE